MSFFDKFAKNFNKIDNKVKLLIAVCLVLLTVGILYPRKQNINVKLEPVPGTSYYQAVFENYENDKKPCIAFFGTSWCGSCKKFQPDWDKFSKTFDKIKLEYVDCDEKKELATQHGIKGFPTVKYLPNGLGDPKGSQTMDGGNNFASLVEFASNFS